MRAKRTRKKRQKILDRKLKIDQPEAHRPQDILVFNSGGGGGWGVRISEEIFNDEPIVQGSGCKHAINQKDRQTLMIVMVNAHFTIYDLPMLLTYG